MRHLISVSLPENEWHVCPTCKGTKSYFMQGDLHRSSGIVPCYHCQHDGWIRTKLVEVTEEEYCEHYGLGNDGEGKEQPTSR